ncbi:TonB-dependent receptor plug domain-containing protein [Sphingomonas sp. H160509]|uniref:TonB-dependent receptor plug domain-containing protein n=1 Tax=Sphingomonas sp. H160509 TaxID=2955313 RepID=UPI00209739C0|nr:TonB-dependent receptor plug domain-containing protein [Sphingomonas sp. H160509]MDD1450275.1 TonB-dependent receptor plug domain-containing protein [Sphingomonas sp. H160509]
MKFITSSALVALLAGTPALAQTAQDLPANASQPNDENQIVVTGTRDRSRTQFDTLAPVDVLSGDAVRSSVSGDLSDTLAQLLPSFNVQRLPAADGQAFVRPATLRGLSADQTLVLINGKRYHRSAPARHAGRASARSGGHPIARDQADRGAARRRVRTIWLRRDRRGGQHHPRRHRRDGCVRPVLPIL